MKNKLLLGVTICSMFLTTNVFAISDNKTYVHNDEYTIGSELKNNLCNSPLGNVVFPNSISIDNKEIELYCVYSNKNDVINQINNQYSDVISFVKNNYNFSEDLSDSNWNEYRNAMNNVSVDFPNISNDFLKRIAVIDAAFDIYENNEVNEEISDLANEIKSSKRMTDEKKENLKEELDLMTPDYSDKFKQNNGGTKVGASLNVTLASSYANAHAKSPNTPTYYYFSNGDCTNFMSQILEYSGVSQVVYDSVYSGWWHKKNGNTHTHSRSWTMANTFSNYMGVTVRTTSIQNWANNLNEGDFVALDKTNDGSFDHMGYITGSNGYTMIDDEVNMVCYNIKNVKIAQHTSNYNDYISSSTNGWENYAGRGAFGRIRG